MSATLAITAKMCVSKCDPGLTLTRPESFSKFDKQQPCSPLTYRPCINYMERLKPPLKYISSSRGWQHIKGIELSSQSDLIFIGLI